MHKCKLIVSSIVLGLFIVGCSDSSSFNVNRDMDQDDQELVGPFTAAELAEMLEMVEPFDEPVPINGIMFVEDDGFGEPFQVNNR
ncbi:MAG: hypothetical protein EA349_15325 [Halomonadaceae bacterium]|nr:MAG: hypothetical protein EA349_15325 [Halomonadaceae bacterium]